MQVAHKEGEKGSYLTVKDMRCSTDMYNSDQMESPHPYAVLIPSPSPRGFSSTNLYSRNDHISVR